jgi:hypothetical protein
MAIELGSTNIQLQKKNELEDTIVKQFKLEDTIASV